MDDVLKSEILLVICEKQEGVSLEEFGGLFHQVHGYYFKLSNYGFSSLKKLLNNMNDLVELKTVNGKEVIICKSTSIHVDVSHGNNSSQATKQIFGLSSISLSSSGPFTGPIVQKHKQAQHAPFQQNHVKVKSRNSATDTKSKTAKSKCSLPGKNINSAVSHTKGPEPVKCGISLNQKSATVNRTVINRCRTRKYVPARPAGNVALAAAAAAAAAKTSNGSKSRSESNSTSSNPKSEGNLTSMQNVRSTNSIPLETQVFYATNGPGIRPNVSYASACANKTQFNNNGQKYTPSNVSAVIKDNSASVTRSYSRAEPRISIQPSSVIKQNFQVLLTQHANGLSVFQLQKIYLFMFKQPLKFKGSTTVKHLLLELKDVVKTEGVGVQMLVFPVVTETPTAAVNGDHDSELQGACSLFFTKGFQKEIVLNPHSSDFLKTQNYKLEEALHLPLHDSPIFTYGHQQMYPMEGHIAKGRKIKHKPSTLQNTQKAVTFNTDDFESSRDQRSVPASDERVFPNYITENPQDKMLCPAQMHNQMWKIYGQEKLSYLCNNVMMRETTTKNAPLQNAPQHFSLPQLILHSSGFTFMMNQQMNGPHNKASGMDLAGAISSFTEQKTPYYSNDVVKGPEQSQQVLSNVNSRMLLQDTNPNQFSDLHVQNSGHLQPHNFMSTMQTYGQTEPPALQARREFQTANNCNIMGHLPSHSSDSLQTTTVLAQIENPSSIQNSQNRKEVEKATSQESAPDSQVINNVKILSTLSPIEKTPDAQSKNVTEKTSQREASASTSSNDLGKAKTHDLYVQGTEQAAPATSDVHKAVNIGTSKSKENESTLPTKHFDECTTSAERITQNSLLSPEPRQEIVDPPQNMSTEPNISVAQSELQNNLESSHEQKDVNTWQTSQGQVCCIL